MRNHSPLLNACRLLLIKIFPLGLLLVTGQRQVLSQSLPAEFKPSGKVWGYAFGDAYFKSAGDTATWASRAEYSGVPEKVYAFALRRMYLGYDYQISPTFSTTALLEGGDGIQTAKGDRSVTIKALHLKWKGIYKGADLLIGQMSTLTFSLIAEKVWNYRSVEKTIADMRGIRSSSDMGIAVYGRFDSLGNYGYNLMMGNGSGTRPEVLTTTGKHKIYYGEVFAYLLDRKLVLDLYGDYQTGVNDRTTMTAKAFTAYQTELLTVGVEVMSHSQNKVKPDGTDATAFGVSLFVRGSIVKNKLGFFTRYDSYDPDTRYREQDVITVYNGANMNRHYDEQFFTGGLDFTPHKNVHLMPNLWVNSYKAKVDTGLLVKRKADIVPRLTFFFIFR